MTPDTRYYLISFAAGAAFEISLMFISLPFLKPELSYLHSITPAILFTVSSVLNQASISRHFPASQVQESRKRSLAIDCLALVIGCIIPPVGVGLASSRAAMTLDNQNLADQH